jgi:hypothetical protein
MRGQFARQKNRISAMVAFLAGKIRVWPAKSHVRQ